MSRKDYYAILGISTKETQHGVKDAFRELAQRYHPDRAGVHSTQRFQDIAEAYQTLGDRARRAEYDAYRRRSRAETTVRPVEPLWDVPAEPFDAEPVTMDRHRARRPSRQFSVMDDLVGSSPGRDRVFDAFRQSFDDRWRRKSARLDPLNLAIGLSREEALSGVDVTLNVPIVSACVDCHGTGRLWVYACSRCGGSGRQMSENAVHLRIPPMVDDDTLFEVPLNGPGIENIYLRLLVRVADHGI